VLHQQIDLSECEYKSDSGTVSATTVFSEIKVNNEYAGLNDQGRADLRFLDNYDPNMLDDEFTISCNVSAIVKEDNYIYKNPQKLQLDMTFKTSNSKLCDTGEKINIETLEGGCNPGMVLGEKIKKQENRMILKSKWMNTISEWMPKLQKFCGMRNSLVDATNAAQMASMVLNAVSIGTGNGNFVVAGMSIYANLHGLDECFSGTRSTAGYGSGNIVGQIDPTNPSQTINDPNFVNNAVSTLGGLFNKEEPVAATGSADKKTPCQRMIGNACDFLMCTKTKSATEVTSVMLDYAKGSVGSDIGSGSSGALPDLFGSDTTFMDETMNELTENINVPDVKNSIVMAAATGCWPAVYYNIDKYRQTGCSYLYCLKMAAYTGTDVSACDAARKTQICSLVVGEVFEWPGANIIKNFMENAADYVGNFLPMAATSIVKKALCQEYVQDSVFKVGKVDMPTDIKTQTWKIYGCQLPLQIARVADYNKRSATRGEFIYPALDNLCERVNCVGEENCTYEPDFMETINRMNISAATRAAGGIFGGGTINTEKSNDQAKINQINEKIHLIDRYDLFISKKLVEKKALEDKHLSTENIIKEIKSYEDGRNEIIKDLQNNYQILQDYEIDPTKISDKVQNNADTYLSAEYLSTNSLREWTSAKSTISTFQSSYTVAPASMEGYVVITQKATGKKLLLDAENRQPDVNKYRDLYTANGVTLTNQVGDDTIDGVMKDYSTYEVALANKEKYLKEAEAKYNKKILDDSTTSMKDCAYAHFRVDGNCVTEEQAKAIQDRQRIEKNIALTETEFEGLDLKQKYQVYADKAAALQQLQAYNDYLSGPTSLIDGTKEFEVNGFSATYAVHKEKYLYYAKSLDLCDPPNGLRCDGTNFNDIILKDPLTGENAALAEYNKKIGEVIQNNNIEKEKYESSVRNYERAEMAGNVLYVALQYANAKHTFDWFFDNDFLSRWFGDRVDPEKLKTSICNGMFGAHNMNIGSTSENNVVVSCESGICQPVLSYAAERTPLQFPNGTAYNIYTATYYISGGDLRGKVKPLKYNIYFKGSSANEIKLFTEDIELKAFSIIQNKTVFKSHQEYNQMCIVFSERFPADNSWTDAFKYCRDILETDVFNNGSPWTIEEENNEAYIDSIDNY
jgi:hypothetical protein